MDGTNNFTELCFRQRRRWEKGGGSPGRCSAWEGGKRMFKICNFDLTCVRDVELWREMEVNSLNDFLFYSVRLVGRVA